MAVKLRLADHQADGLMSEAEEVIVPVRVVVENDDAVFRGRLAVAASRVIEHVTDVALGPFDRVVLDTRIVRRGAGQMPVTICVSDNESAVVHEFTATIGGGDGVPAPGERVAVAWQ